MTNIQTRCDSKDALCIYALRSKNLAPAIKFFFGRPVGSWPNRKIGKLNKSRTSIRKYVVVLSLGCSGTSASDWLQRSTRYSAITCYVLTGTSNPAHSLTQSSIIDCVLLYIMSLGRLTTHTRLCSKQLNILMEKHFLTPGRLISIVFIVLSLVPS